MTNRTDIIVVGFPKSGNTHLARTLGDLLDSPVMGKYAAHPIAEEGLDRTGDYIVRQLHLLPTPDDYGTFIPDAWSASLPCWKDERVVLILRDPRDVALSAKHYWDIPTTCAALRRLNGDPKGVVNTTLREFVTDWLGVLDSSGGKRIAAVKYERLIAKPEKVLTYLCETLDIHYDPERISYAIEKNKFENRQKDVEKYGDDKSHYPSYHLGIQRKNLNKGLCGEWRAAFTQAEGELAQKLFGDLLFDLSYETDPDWWRSLQP